VAVEGATSSSPGSALLAMASVGLPQVVMDCEPEVSRTHGSTVGRSVGVWLHEESPVESLEGFDP